MNGSATRETKQVCVRVWMLEAEACFEQNNRRGTLLSVPFISQLAYLKVHTCRAPLNQY